MSRLSHHVSQHGDLQRGEPYANLHYLLLTSLLSQAVIFYDTCYQLNSPSPPADIPNDIWDDIPALEDEHGNIVPCHYRRPKERAWPFSKL